MNTLEFKAESKIIYEYFQKVFVQFLNLNGFRIELIQPENDDSPVANFMKKGGLLNHICYESDDIEFSKVFFREKYGAICVSSEMSASIVNCKVAFFAKPDGEVIELVQPFEGTKYFSSSKKHL